MVAIQYKPVGFPDQLICECGEVQSVRNLILRANENKRPIDEDDFPEFFFTGFACHNCSNNIWYAYLDYSTDTREIQLVTPDPMSLNWELDDPNHSFQDTIQLFERINKRYLVELEFPASLYSTEYISHHEISHIKDDIISTLPLLVVRPKPMQTNDQNIILVIPYVANDQIYGEIKVNFNLAERDRKMIADLSFGIWDLLSDHYFGPLHTLDYNMEKMLLRDMN